MRIFCQITPYAYQPLLNLYHYLSSRWGKKLIINNSYQKFLKILSRYCQVMKLRQTCLEHPSIKIHLRINCVCLNDTGRTCRTDHLDFFLVPLSQQNSFGWLYIRIILLRFILTMALVTSFSVSFDILFMPVILAKQKPLF